MKLFEMDGFLRGKCLPGDMKVNETNAEYLVRKFTELEQKLAESQREFRAVDATIENLQMQVEKLAAENAQMLRLLTDISENHDEYVNQDEYLYAGIPMDYVSEINSYVSRDVEAENPFKATDAFLAEVRAQGVETAIDTAKNVVAQEFQYKDFEAAQRVCSKFPESDLVGKVEMVEWLEEFAAQIRKGVQS
ncbi:hypothetical protein [Enterobacter roggenkampii]|uniref:hypothetical protein n=1 Tax=Enterobacter roggenkampii TaxID=1812935 RepID=UPI0008DE7DAE|nr:hypothetical protein [Enterobacter roggenkampii]OHY72438.1 hypothetical protein BB775_26615 [Enterobacter roggenkampii]